MSKLKKFKTGVTADIAGTAGYKNMHTIFLSGSLTLVKIKIILLW
jgi:hypothetical protein